jgi:hypothetical protein
MMGDKRQARKPKIFLKDDEKLALHQKVFELSSSGVKYTSADIWRKAQEMVLKPERHVSYASLLNLSKDHDNILRSGKIGVKPAPHDHRPIAERGFVAVTPAPSPTPTPTPAPAPVATQPPQVPTMMPMGIFGHLDTVISAYLGVILAKQLDPVIKEIVQLSATVAHLRQSVAQIPEQIPQVDGQSIIEPIMIRLSAVEKSQAELIKLWTDSPSTSTPTATPAPVLPDGLSTTPPQIKRPVKVLAVPGDFVGPWDQLTKELPNAVVVFGDDQKVESLPKGKEFDVVIVTYRTSSGARNRMNTHYTKQLLFLQREQHETMLSTIKSRVDAVQKLL